MLDLQDGIGYSFGVFLPSLTTYFNSSKAATGLIFAIQNLLQQVYLRPKRVIEMELKFNCFQGSGPISAYLIEIIGYKITCLLGSIITSLSFLLTATMIYFNLLQIIPFYFITGTILNFISSLKSRQCQEYFAALLLGVLSGLGLGFTYMVSRAIITEWFDKNLKLKLDFNFLQSQVHF